MKKNQNESTAWDVTEGQVDERPGLEARAVEARAVEARSHRMTAFGRNLLLPITVSYWGNDRSLE